MNGIRALSVAGVLAVLTACGSDGDTPPVADPTATDATATTTGGSPTTGDGGQDRCAGEATSHEEAARCVYAAFVADDRQAAGSYATQEAVEDLFALGGFGTDAHWAFDGCGDPRETVPSSGVSCHYRIPGEPHGVAVEMAMRDDFVVESVASIG